MKVRISGIEGLEGEYDIAEPPFATKEWREIKQHTGLMPLDMEEHNERRDPDVYASLLWVTLTRAGKDSRFVWTMLDQSDMFANDLFSEVAAPGEEEEVEQIPPELTPPSTDDGNETETDDSPESSGQSSQPPLALLESAPSPTGFPRSATGAA